MSFAVASSSLFASNSVNGQGANSRPSLVPGGDQTGVIIVGSAKRRRELEAKLGSVRSVLVRGSVPSLSGIEDRQELPSTVVILDLSGVRSADHHALLSALEDPVFCAVVLVEDFEHLPLRELMQSGNLALLLSDATAWEIEAAVKGVAAGWVMLDPEIAKHLAERLPRPILSSDEDIEGLTERENQVLTLLSRGLGNKQMAAQLGISEHTVKFHISSILAKLGVESRTEAVTQAIRHGLISL